MDQGTVGWLEAILQRKSQAQFPVKVIDVQSSDVVGKGENYMSTLTRIKAKVLLGSGRTKQISLVVKNQHTTGQKKKISVESGVFFTELTMYRDVLQKMEDLLEEVCDIEGIFWGRMYDYRYCDRLVFEDLGAAGYKMLNRHKQMGLDSALIVIRQLAKLHALSRILLLRGDIPMDIFGTHYWLKDKNMSDETLEIYFQNLISMMKQWGDEWKEGVQRLEKAAPDLPKKLYETLTMKPDDFTVLIHGDCWTNNMLFQYDDPEYPTSVKFLDWQITCVSTPARDIHMFLSTSVRMDVQEDPTKLDRILQTYCTVLKDNLLKCNYEGFIPDESYIKEMLKNTLILTMEMCCMLIPVVLADKKDAPDMAELFKRLDEFNEGEENAHRWSPTDVLNPTSERVIKSIMKQALESGSI